MADDFILSILMLKSKDCESLALPFLHAHALELSAKCALLTLDPRANVSHHNLKLLYDDIAKFQTEFSSAIPPQESFEISKKLYPPPTGGSTIVTWPENMDRIWEYELCYFIANVADLKYGFFKDGKQVSVTQIPSEQVNREFLKLFFACRRIYKNDDLDGIIRCKSVKVFGASLFEMYKDCV